MADTSPIPLSELGRLTGRFYLTDSIPLIAMNCYFDGSIGGRNDEWLTIGGFVASDRTWARLQRNWERMLRERYPIAPYVHMSDLITGNDPFERKAGWSQEKVDKLVVDARDVLGSISPHDICAFACSIDTSARKRLMAEGYDITDPAVICAELSLGNLINWYTRKHGVELAYLFYDQNEPFIRSIRRRWRKANNHKKLVTDELLWGRIANVAPVPMERTPGIQAADIIAWSFTRRLRNEPGDQWSTLADELIGNRQRRGILTNTQVDPITEDLLRVRYPKHAQKESDIPNVR